MIVASWPFLIMCVGSSPAMRARAQRNDLNPSIGRTIRLAELMLADEYERSGTKQRLIDEFTYAADSWDIERRVITRLKHGSLGNNPRFIVTNFEGNAILTLPRFHVHQKVGNVLMKEERDEQEGVGSEPAIHGRVQG